MCGICGVIFEDGSKVDAADVRRMANILRHRGPDDEGVFVDEAGTAALGHRRLSVIDVAGGHQPLSNENGSLQLVCNGEIYNFPSLRKQLEAGGHRFATNSDNEVILHLYEEHGDDCLQHLRGMFAFGLWDSHRRRLLLARDRMGQKPLFWHRADGRLLFASSLAAILQYPGVKRTISPEAIHHFLTYQYVPHPLSIYREISKLPPAHRLVWQAGKMQMEPYWQPRLEVDSSRSVSAWQDELYSLLEESVQMRLISDVPLGAFLSGGIDSSIIVGMMARLMKEPVKTFSIGFKHARYDERSYARLVAEKFGTDHREFVVEPNALEMLPELIRHYAEPFGDSSAIPTFYLSRVTREHVTVALTGDGGDELFAGYPRYTATRLAGKLSSLPVLGRLVGSPLWKYLPSSVEQKTMLRRLKKLMLAGGTPIERYFNWIAIFNEQEKQHLYRPDFAEQAAFDSFERLRKLYDDAGTHDPVAAVAYADTLSYLPDDILTKVDIATMSVALEARSPFLDHPFVEAALRIPTALKMPHLTGKYILKEAFRVFLPPELLHRRKMGFGVPISAWFRTELAGYLREVLLAPDAFAAKRFQPQVLERLVEDHFAGRADHGYKLWNLLILELWEREFEG